MIRRLKPEHAELIQDIRQPEAVDDIRAALETYLSIGEGYSIFNKKDELIAIGGMVSLWPGVGDFWMVTSTKVEQNKLLFYKDTRRLFIYGANKYKLHRAQCQVRADNRTSQAWLKRLGFTFESVKSKFGADKTDYWEYVCLF